MKTRESVLRQFENKILELEDDLESGSLTNTDLKRLYQKRYDYRDRYAVDTRNSQSKIERKIAARYNEYFALVAYAGNRDRETVDMYLELAYKALSGDADFVSEKANELMTKDRLSIEHYEVRKETVNDYVQSVGSQTPQQLITIIIIAALIIGGIIYVMSRPASTDPTDQGPDCSSQPYSSGC